MQPCISNASFQPSEERLPLFRLLKNPITGHEPLIFLADQVADNEVSLQIFDLTGILLTNKFYPKGNNQVLSLSPNLRAGVYVAAIASGAKKQVLRFVVAGR